MIVAGASYSGAPATTFDHASKSTNTTENPNMSNRSKNPAALVGQRRVTKAGAKAAGGQVAKKDKPSGAERRLAAQKRLGAQTPVATTQAEAQMVAQETGSPVKVVTPPQTRRSAARQAEAAATKAAATSDQELAPIGKDEDYKPVADLENGPSEKDLDPEEVESSNIKFLRSVPCPTCKAKVGSPCKRPSGHTIFGGDVHAPRRAAAHKAREKDTNNTNDQAPAQIPATETRTPNAILSIESLQQAAKVADETKAAKKAASKKGKKGSAAPRAPITYHPALADFDIEIQRRYTGHANHRIKELAAKGITETLDDAIVFGLTNSRNLRGGKAPKSVVDYLATKGLTVKEASAGKSSGSKGSGKKSLRADPEKYAREEVQNLGGKRARKRIETLATDARAHHPEFVDFYEAALSFIRE